MFFVNLFLRCQNITLLETYQLARTSCIFLQQVIFPLFHGDMFPCTSNGDTFCLLFIGRSFSTMVLTQTARTIANMFVYFWRGSKTSPRVPSWKHVFVFPVKASAFVIVLFKGWQLHQSKKNWLTRNTHFLLLLLLHSSKYAFVVTIFLDHITSTNYKTISVF